MKTPIGLVDPFDALSYVILSLFCTLANPHHSGDAYMALDGVVAWATRWRESAGDPFDRSVLRAYNDDEAEDMTLFGMGFHWHCDSSPV